MPIPSADGSKGGDDDVRRSGSKGIIRKLG